MARYGHVVFSSPGNVVEVLLGEGNVKVTDGYGGWETVERPKNLAFTRWVGGLPYKMEIPVMFDGHIAGVSQESKINGLERMGRNPGGNVEPPLVTISGPVPRGPGVGWVIDNIDWQEAMLNDAGQRVRQLATVTVMQHVKPDGIKLSVATKRKASKPAPKKKRRK